MSGVEVRPVHTPRERRLFLTFPWRVYRNDPLWVPPLLPERAGVIDPARGPFFKRGEAEFFIAWRDGRPVGTIAAAEDPPTNRARGAKECLFGFFETIQDYTVAEAMFAHVSEWARRRGLNALYGPFNLDYEDAYGILLEGRDRPPAIFCGHTPPYYRDFVEQYGFTPARAINQAYAIDLADSPTYQRLARLADRLRERRDFTIREADLANWKHEADLIHELLGQALGHLGDHIPWHRETVYAMLEPFTRIADPELVLFAEDGDRTVGWLPAIPNLNEVFAHVNGLRYPWNYLQLAWHMRHQTESLAVKSVLVLPEYWGTGAAVLLFDEISRRGRAKGYRWIDLSLTSADNPQTPKIATRMGAKLYKQYQVYRLPV